MNPAIVLVLIELLLTPVLLAEEPPPEWNTQVYGAESFIGRSDTTAVPECSGVVASRRNPRVFWTHNDSGTPYPRVYAFQTGRDGGRSGVQLAGYVDLPGAGLRDWEDIAAGPNHTIYVLDGGDNPPCDRGDKFIYRFVEPAIPPTGPLFAMTAKYESLWFEYPDPKEGSTPAGRDEDRYDAECLLVHPLSGDVYIVTKRNHANLPRAHVYKLPAARIGWDSGRCHVLEQVADVTSATVNMITAGDVDPRGRRVVLRSYLGAFEYTLPAGQPFDDVFRQPARTIPLAAEATRLLQGEGICYTADGRSLVTTTEAGRFQRDQRFMVFLIPWRLANLRVTDITGSSVVVAWDTAEKLESQVDYFVDRPAAASAPAEGRIVRDEVKTTAHRVSIGGLSPGTRYHFQVRSGALVYPASAPADEASFTTRDDKP